MYEKFEQLDKEKKDKIFNAGFKEFGTNGYEKGSTNKIVKEAEISKGLIFHYFGSKENFYLYLIDYTVDFLMAKLNSRVDHSIRDFLKIIEEYMVNKIEIFNEYPRVFDFIKSYMSEENPEVKDKIWVKLTSVREETNAIFSNIDYTLFKEDLEPGMIISTIMNTLEKVSYGGFLDVGTDYDMDGTVIEIRKYLAFFRKAFYK